MTFENSLKLGNGIYTIPEISKILQIPYQRARNWIVNYWDKELGKFLKGQYSWSVDKSRAVGFHTLIEIYLFIQFSEAGVSNREIIKAHKELSKTFNTAFPFAKKEILNSIECDGKKIVFNYHGSIINLDGTNQINLTLVKAFFSKLEFDEELIASRYWPLGKEKSIVIDPKRKFGHPILSDSNIYPETIYNLYKGGESIESIMFMYDISKIEAEDALEYCKAA